MIVTRGTSQLRLDRGMRTGIIENGLRRSQKNPEKFGLHQKWVVRPINIQRALLDPLAQASDLLNQHTIGSPSQNVIPDEQTNGRVGSWDS